MSSLLLAGGGTILLLLVFKDEQDGRPSSRAARLACFLEARAGRIRLPALATVLEEDELLVTAEETRAHDRDDRDNLGERRDRMEPEAKHVLQAWANGQAGDGEEIMEGGEGGEGGPGGAWLGRGEGGGEEATPVQYQMEETAGECDEAALEEEPVAEASGRARTGDAAGGRGGPGVGAAGATRDAGSSLDMQAAFCTAARGLRERVRVGKTWCLVLVGSRERLRKRLPSPC